MRLIHSLATVVVSLFAVSAGATVSVNLVGPGTATPGSLITLQTFVTANGGEKDITLFGGINYPDATINPNPGGNSQINLSTVGTAAAGWSSGVLPCASTFGTFCAAFNQINPIAPAAAGLTDFNLAITTFVIDPLDPVGTVINFTWADHAHYAELRLVWAHQRAWRLDHRDPGAGGRCVGGGRAARAGDRDATTDLRRFVPCRGGAGPIPI